MGKGMRRLWAGRDRVPNTVPKRVRLEAVPAA